MPKITGPHPCAHRRGEDVDNLLGLSAEQVCSQDEVRPFFNERLVAGTRLSDPARRIPAWVISFCTRNFKPLSLASRSLSPTDARGGIVKTTVGMAR